MLPFRVLFHENGDPIDQRCIHRFIVAFPKHYHNVVRDIVKKSAVLDEKAFKFNVATLIPSFKMTRKGVFHGVKAGKNGRISDPNGIIDKCWRAIGSDLLVLREKLDKEELKCRGRAIVDCSSSTRDSILSETARLFEKLLPICKGKTSTGKVGASKVLFAALPEVALPVDNAEWNRVFKTERYSDVLSRMANEIVQWEGMTKCKLDELDLTYPEATLPSVYNIMAMAVRGAPSGTPR